MGTAGSKGSEKSPQKKGQVTYQKGFPDKMETRTSNGTIEK